MDLPGVAGEVSADAVDEEIRRRLGAQRMRGDFAAIHAAPASPAEVPDQAGARLVVLGPEHPHREDGGSPAADRAAALLEVSGDGVPRVYRNMLVFLAGDAVGLEALRATVRRYLAGEALAGAGAGAGGGGLEAEEAPAQARAAGEEAGALIGEVWQWLLAPSSAGWQVSRAAGRQELAMRASRQLRAEGSLFVEYPAVRLRADLDTVPLWPPGARHIPLAEVWEAYASSLALPRLRSSAVLAAAIVSGIAAPDWASDTFAYAESWDAERGRYQGLAAGRPAVALQGSGLLVAAQAARAQLDAERGGA